MKTTAYVDPFLGNGSTDYCPQDELCKRWFFLKAQCGNTHPGACLPFGMVSVCPYSGGYPTGYGTHAPNTHGRAHHFTRHLCINGFTHFQQSGTGGIERYYNFVRVVPMKSDEADVNAYCEIVEEQASPGYYKSDILERKTCAELTVSKGAAVHRYTFDKPGKLAVDLVQSGLHPSFGSSFSKQVDALSVSIESENHISAKLQVDEMTLFIYFYCPQNTDTPSIWKGDAFHYSHTAEYYSDRSAQVEGILFEHISETVELYVGFSLASAQAAKFNSLHAAALGFDACRYEAGKIWDEMLSHAQIKSKDEKLKAIYYTALYHSIIKPAQFLQDGGELGEWLDFATLWDMYKTQMPLINTLYPKQAADIVTALAISGEKSQGIPNAILLCRDKSLFPYQARMLGSYIIADAFWRKVPNVNWIQALNAATLGLYKSEHSDFLKGNLPVRFTHMLDSAEGCFALAEMAQAMDQEHLVTPLLNLASQWPNVYDAKTGLLKTDSEYYEGTLYNYSFRLLHEMKRRIELAGGKERFIQLLDDFFGYGMAAVDQPTDPQDINYMMWGHSLHRFEGFNNEPDMEAPYAYLYVGRHDRTCEIIRWGSRSMFHIGRGGLPGNDDSGGLSSCLVWNILGLFPVVGQQIMLIGSPSVEEAVLSLHDGKQFQILVHGQSEQSIYVERLTLNGTELSRCYLQMDEFMSGGILEFFMTNLAVNDHFSAII